MKIYLSKPDQAPFIELLEKNEIKFTRRMFFRDAVDAKAFLHFLEIVCENPAAWAALAAIIRMHIRAHHGCKVIIKKEATEIRGEGLTEAGLAKLLESANSLAIESPNEDPITREEKTDSD